jgi:N-acetylglucosaminyl-diphospho-decaprenol L-rhamnosyltransferase
MIMGIGSMPTELSVIIVNWNTREFLEACLESLISTVTDIPFDVWVVDNGSTDGSQEMVRNSFPTINLITNTDNIGFARANNQAMQRCQGNYMLLFNSDAIAEPGAVHALLDLAKTHPRAGIVGAQLVNPDNSFQASYSRFPSLFREFLILTGLGRLIYGRWYPSQGPEIELGPQIVDYVEGACLLVNRKAFMEVGGLDEGYFMYAEEVDWCCTMQRKGWQVWYQPEARVIHYAGGSSRFRKTYREADLYRSRVRFFRKNHGELQAAILKWMIVGLTALKILAHRMLKGITRGHRGRVVVPMHELINALKGI